MNSRVLALAWISLLAACVHESNAQSIDETFAREWEARAGQAEQFEEGWPYTRAPNYPYGVWISADGFRIELRRDGTYLVCRNESEVCDRGRFERSEQVVIILRGFNVPEHRVAQQLVSLTSRSSHWTHGADLDFTPNMGPPANAEHCGGHPCVMLGAHLSGSEFIFILQGDGQR